MWNLTSLKNVIYLLNFFWGGVNTSNDVEEKNNNLFYCRYLILESKEKNSTIIT